MTRRDQAQYGKSVWANWGIFNPESEKVSTYLERVQLYLEANGVGDNKKVAVLLTVVGSKCYGLLESLSTSQTEGLRSTMNQSPWRTQSASSFISGVSSPARL